MDKKLKAISKVSLALALLGAAAPVTVTAPTAMAAKKAAKKSTKKTKKAKKSKKKVVKKTNAQKYAPKAKSVTVKAGSKTRYITIPSASINYTTGAISNRLYSSRLA